LSKKTFPDGRELWEAVDDQALSLTGEPERACHAARDFYHTDHRPDHVWRFTDL
jgi:hypothetical protein